MIEFHLISLLAISMAIVLVAVTMRAIMRVGMVAFFYPPVFLVVFFVFFFLLPAATAVLFEESLIYRYEGTGYSPTSWTLALVYAFGFIILAVTAASVFCSISTFAASSEKVHARIKVGQLESRVDVIYMVIFYLLPCLSLGYMLARFGGANYADYMVDRIVARKGLGFIIMPSTWLTISIAVMLFSAFSGIKSRSSLLLSIPLLLVYIALQLYFGSKSRGLIVIVYAGLAWSFWVLANRVMSLKTFVILPALAVVVSIVGLYFGDLREATTKGTLVSDVDTRVALGALFSKFNAFGAIENTVWLIENIDYDEVIGGKSFLAVLVGAIPRALWPGKPVGGGPELRNLVHPGSYDLEIGFQLSSYSPGIIAESYMNYGYAGVFIIAPLFGLVLGCLARIVGKIDSPLMLIMYIMLLYKVTYMLTGEVFGSIAGIFMTVSPVILYLVMLRLRRVLWFNSHPFIG